MAMTRQVVGRELVDGGELVRRLGVGRTTVWRLARARRVPYHAGGRRWMFDPAEVVAALRGPDKPERERGGQAR